MFGALKCGFRSMASLILVRNVVGELRPKRTLAASRGFLAAARLSCWYSEYRHHWLSMVFSHHHQTIIYLLGFFRISTNEFVIRACNRSFYSFSVSRTTSLTVMIFTCRLWWKLPVGPILGLRFYWLAAWQKLTGGLWGSNPPEQHRLPLIPNGERDWKLKDGYE